MSLKGLDDLDDEKEGVSLQDILMGLMDGEKDLELKTEIFSPKDLAGLDVLAEALKMDKLKGSSKLIVFYIMSYLRKMVSYKRRSRTEVISAIAGMLDRETSKLTISDKMTTNIK